MVAFPGIAVVSPSPDESGYLSESALLSEELLSMLRICDSMAASLMQRFGVDACVVGADRVAANGDTANKIGTYALAVLCRHHGVPFYVTAPLTTLDAGA